MSHIPLRADLDLPALAADIKTWARELGFQQAAITDTNLGEHPARLARWLARGFHGGMGFFEDNQDKRTRPEVLIPDTVRVISLRMDYLPPNARIKETLSDPTRAYVARYALGRDYHRVVRKRVQQLASRIEAAIGPFGYRAFVDSAPVMEKPLAAKAGLGWMGKHTVIINRHAGSWFFLAELFTDLPLPVDAPTTAHCGSCSACIDICPTKAIVAPYQLDARLCISYLTIEHRGTIAEELRPLIGNRVFGCDDCQLVCPWNRYAKAAAETGFHPRSGLEHRTLLELFQLDEQGYLDLSEGSPLRRAGYSRFLRNLAIGLGNAPYDPAIVTALAQRLAELDEVVAEHVRWALAQQLARAAQTDPESAA